MLIIILQSDKEFLFNDTAMDQQGIYKMKKINKIIWIDPNNVANELIELSFYFGASNIKHYRDLASAKQYVKGDLHSKFIVMVSSKVFTPAGRDLQIFEDTQNVYPKFIIFCGKKSAINLDTISQQYVFEIIDETYFIMEAIQKIEIEIEKKSAMNQSCRLFFASDEKKSSELKTCIQMQIKKLYWDGIMITTLSFQDAVDEIDSHQSQCFVYSTFNEIQRQKIYDCLEDKQMLSYWHEIKSEKEEVPTYEEEQLTLNCISLSKFADIARKEAFGDTQIQ